MPAFTKAAAGARHRTPRRVVAIGATLLALVAIAALWAWRASLEPAPVAAPAAPPVPEHQRSGPLANPWGSGIPVTSSPGPGTGEATVGPGQASGTPQASAAANAGTGTGSSATAAAAAGAKKEKAPPTREALQQALARWRAVPAGANAAAFVADALRDADPAALVVTWMVERQCRQATNWRQMMELRARAYGSGYGSAYGSAGGVPHDAGRPLTGARTPSPSQPRGPAPAVACDHLPEAPQLEAALEAAGFPPTPEMLELTRRPADLALAIAVGDPMLLAEVAEATPAEAMNTQLQALGVRERDLPGEVQRAGLWLASCTAFDAAGRPSTGGALRAACRDHPALWQACLHHGLCDARDLRDLLLRTLPANELHAAERIATALVPRIGR